MANDVDKHRLRAQTRRVMETRVQPKAYIFDFDGVIVDSLSLHLEGWLHGLKVVYGAKVDNIERFRGLSTQTIAQKLAGEIGVNPEGGELETLVFEKNQYVLKQANQLTVPKTVVQILTHLGWERRSNQGPPFGVASNASRLFIQRILQSQGLGWVPIFGREDVDRAKPFPDVFIACAKSLGLSESQYSQVVAFDDSPHGIQAIVSAGMYAVGVTSCHSEAGLRASGAEETVPTIEVWFN